LGKNREIVGKSLVGRPYTNEMVFLVSASTGDLDGALALLRADPQGRA
jgi:hypothetical protein